MVTVDQASFNARVEHYFALFKYQDDIFFRDTEIVVEQCYKDIQDERYLDNVKSDPIYRVLIRMGYRKDSIEYEWLCVYNSMMPRHCAMRSLNAEQCEHVLRLLHNHFLGVNAKRNAFKKLPVNGSTDNLSVLVSNQFEVCIPWSVKLQQPCEWENADIFKITDNIHYLDDNWLTLINRYGYLVKSDQVLPLKNVTLKTALLPHIVIKLSDGNGNEDLVKWRVTMETPQLKTTIGSPIANFH
jgi:hypothetical protein